MRNTPDEIVRFTAIIDELEDALFEKLKSMRELADTGNIPRIYRIRQRGCNYLLDLQQARWNLNNDYGFDPIIDASSVQMVKDIREFVTMQVK